VQNIYPIIALVIVFALVVLVHEFGHMLFALASKVEVTDFALGLGPSLFSKELGGTRYHVCALPLGGFVKIAGMEPEDTTDSPRSYRTKKPITKIAILSAGSLFNFLLGVILIFALAFIGFPREVVLVRGVVKGSPAEEAGFQPGDVIYTINGERLKDEFSLRRAVSQAEGRRMVFVVERLGKPLQLEVTPRSFDVPDENGNLVPYNEGKPSIGIMHTVEALITTKVEVVVPNSDAVKAGIKPGDEILEVDRKQIALGSDLYFYIALRKENESALQGKQKEGSGGLARGSQAPKDLMVKKPDISIKLRRGDKIISTFLPAETSVNSLGILFKSELERLPFGETVKRALKNVYVTTALLVENLRLLGTKEGFQLLSGPVAIGSIIAQSAKSGIYTLIQIAMVITVNLGLINLFPIPPLDGGRVFFVLLEMVGLNIQEKKRHIADLVGMAFLISLIILLTFRDVLGLIRMALA